ncbi:MAG: Type secretion system pilin [Patescibacteria group bacterium]|nr:Type secretion system pilin [Patescibacteria group bacterium]
MTHLLTNFAQSMNAKIDSGDIKNLPALTADQVLHNGLNIFYFVVGAVAVLAIIIAGFYFVTDGSNPATVTKAKNIIIYSVMGIVIVIAAFALTQFVMGSF